MMILDAIVKLQREARDRDPPSHWRKIEVPPVKDLAKAWQHYRSRMTVLRSLTQMQNGDVFIHISAAHHADQVTWDDLVKVKREFLNHEPAYHVIVSEKDHVNVHWNCFHLWQPVGTAREVANLRNIVREREW